MASLWAQRQGIGTFAIEWFMLLPTDCHTQAAWNGSRSKGHKWWADRTDTHRQPTAGS